jgi:hypothetical protein
LPNAIAKNPSGTAENRPESGDANETVEQDNAGRAAIKMSTRLANAHLTGTLRTPANGRNTQLSVADRIG